MNLIRDPRQEPAAGDRLLLNGSCRLIVAIERDQNTTRAVRWVNGHQFKTLHTVPAHARDTASSSTIGSWRAWAKSGASILSEVKVA